MKVCVFGAGAVGGYLAAALGKSSRCELYVVGRGPHLDQIKRAGIHVSTQTQSWTVRPTIATDDPSVLPRQDIVFVTLKSTSQIEAAGTIGRLLDAGGHAVFVANGVPWWWNVGIESACALALPDEHAKLWKQIDPKRVLGCVVYSGNEVLSPGHIRHVGGNRWIVGEPSNRLSERLSRTIEILNHAGLAAEFSQNLRQEVLAKLLLNASYNSVAALTGLPIEWFSASESVARLVCEVIDELAVLSQAMGYDVDAARTKAKQIRPLPRDLELASGQKPSMLQDVMAGRSTEVEALLGHLCHFANNLGIDCPRSRTLLALLRGVNVRLAAAGKPRKNAFEDDSAQPRYGAHPH